MSWLTNHELQTKLQRNATMSVWNAFGGIYPIDMLPPRIPRRPIFIIINTDTKNLPGKHWKAVYIKEDNAAEVFDSLALPLNVHTENWLNKFTTRWSLNCRACQHPLSASCGSFVLYFILNRLNYHNFDVFLKTFSPNVTVNEQMICKFYRQLH